MKRNKTTKTDDTRKSIVINWYIEIEKGTKKRNEILFL